MMYVTLVLACTLCAADMHAKPTDQPPTGLIAGLGTHHHRVAATNRDAQQLFDQGLSLLGLAASLRAQKKEYAAPLVQGKFEEAWKRAEPRSLKLGEM